MPLVQGQNTFTQRIYQGDVLIRRVYLGDNLMWGLYDITYHLAGGTQGNNAPSEYVWGIADIELPKPTWSNQQYYTKFNGWYEGNTYVTAVPAIEKNLHKDLELYAKWTQRKYTYSGTYSWTEQEWVPGGGSASFDPYTDTDPYSSGNNRWEGQCTRWCYNRSAQAFGTPCLTGYPNANEWLSGGTLGSGWSRLPGESPQPGDVVVFDDSGNYGGHVIFQETYSIITQSNVRKPGGDWNTVINGRTERFSCVNLGTPSVYLGNYRLGVLRYGGSGSGHYESVTKYGNVSETENPTQKPPTRPNPPQGNWSQFNEYTYTRDYNYPSNNWGGWGNQQSGWDQSGNGTEWL